MSAPTTNLDASGKNGIVEMLKKPVLTILGAGVVAALLSGSDFIDATTAMNGGLGAAIGAYAGGFSGKSWGPWVGAVALPALIGGEVDAVTVGAGVAAGAIYTQL